MAYARDYKTLTMVVGVIAAVALVVLLVNTVVGEIGYYRQVDYSLYIHHSVIMALYGPAALASIVGGFWYMRKAPMLGALLVTAGSVAFAIALFWLILPELIAAGISYFAYRRARRLLTYYQSREKLLRSSPSSLFR